MQDTQFQAPNIQPTWNPGAMLSYAATFPALNGMLDKLRCTRAATGPP